LFGGRRAIRVKAGGRDFSSALATLVADPPRDCRIVIEAGDLRRNSPLRTLCERAKSVAAIACYLDGDRALGRRLDDDMRAAGIAPPRISAAAVSQAAQLHRARLSIEAGASTAEVADQVVPRAQFRRRPAIEAALSAWTAARLERVMADLAAATLETRRLSGSLADLADPVVGRALLITATT